MSNSLPKRQLPVSEFLAVRRRTFATNIYLHLGLRLMRIANRLLVRASSSRIRGRAA